MTIPFYKLSHSIFETMHQICKPKEVSQDLKVHYKQLIKVSKFSDFNGKPEFPLLYHISKFFVISLLYACKYSKVLENKQWNTHLGLDLI